MSDAFYWEGLFFYSFGCVAPSHSSFLVHPLMRPGDKGEVRSWRFPVCRAGVVGGGKSVCGVGR